MSSTANAGPTKRETLKSLRSARLVVLTFLWGWLALKFLPDQLGKINNFVTGVLAHLQLGRAANMERKIDKARKHYQDFFALWKDADPGASMLKQAKVEYTRLNELHLPQTRR